TTGFIIHDGSSGLIYSGDTGPTETLWRTARGLHGLRAVILECAFPNRLGPLAEIAKHLTPALISRELDKLPPDPPVLTPHRKRAADLDLVEVPRALEHAERDLPGDARAARHRRLGE